jgi:succinyl-diaminopimelate desuccinylase
MKIDHIIDLAKQLIIIPSISGDQTRAIEIIEFVKTLLPNMPFSAFAHEGIPSLLFSNQEGQKQFKIILNIHLDVVPGEEKLFAPTIKDGKLYGRGAYDMKAAAAANILLFQELAPKLSYPLGLQITTDEETGGLHGTAHQLQQGIISDFMLTAECGSNFDIIYEAKGMLHILLTAKGKRSHSAYPWLGENAIMKIYEAIQAIHIVYPQKKEEGYYTTTNLIHIITNNSSTHTVTPDHCEARLDIRYIPEDKPTILMKLESVLPKDVSMQVVFHTPPHETKSDNPYIQKLQQTAEGVLHKTLKLKKQHATSDARFYTRANCDAVEFGPVGVGQHTDKECIDIASVEKYYTVMKSFLLSLE